MGRVTVSVEINSPGYLILSDLFHPGWQGTVNGAPVRVLAGTLACRVVPLPVGKHVVRFRSELPGKKTGVAVSLMAILGLLISAWVSRCPGSSPAGASNGIPDQRFATRHRLGFPAVHSLREKQQPDSQTVAQVGSGLS